MPPKPGFAIVLAACLGGAAAARAGEIQATVLDADGKGLPDAVVFASKAPGGPFSPPEQALTMDQIGNEYVPHVLPVLAGTTVVFPNKDNTRHHVYSFSKAKKFELPLYKDEPADPVKFDVPGVVKLGCNIHDWMIGYVVVLETPHFAKTGPDGKAVLKGLPEGSYELQAWSERVKGDPKATLQKLTVGAQPAKALFSPKLGPKIKPAKKVY